MIGTILTLSLWRLAAASTINYCLGWKASKLSYGITHASTAAWLCDCVFTACTYLRWRENPGGFYQKQTLVEMSEDKQSDNKTMDCYLTTGERFCIWEEINVVRGRFRLYILYGDSHLRAGHNFNNKRPIFAQNHCRYLCLYIAMDIAILSESHGDELIQEEKKLIEQPKLWPICDTGRQQRLAGLCSLLRSTPPAIVK